MKVKILRTVGKSIANSVDALNPLVEKIDKYVENSQHTLPDKIGDELVCRNLAVRLDQPNPKPEKEVRPEIAKQLEHGKPNESGDLFGEEKQAEKPKRGRPRKDVVSKPVTFNS